MDNKHGGKKSQRTRFCTWKLTEEREKKSSVPCVPFVKWKKTPIHFRFPAFNPRDFSARRRRGCSDKCLEFFGQFCTDKQTSCKTILFECRKSRATLGYCRKKSLFIISSFQFIRHTKVCRVFFFCCCYGLCLNQPKMSAYLTSFARLAQPPAIAICNITLFVLSFFSKYLCAMHCNL